MRAIIVSVDYADILSITLPYNKRHFEQVWVVTAERDEATLAVAVANHCRTFVTNSFWDDGAAFNKWVALEQGLDAMGREGWLCLMDADVLWPKMVKLNDVTHSVSYVCEDGTTYLRQGFLYTPRRRMLSDWRDLVRSPQEPELLLKESQWSVYPLHRQAYEFAGYSQIFHASDPVLGHPPWHQTNWTHCGGADSFFQAKWPEARKIRPPFEVLHLGDAGQNWFGRATPLANGTVLPGSAERMEASARRIWNQRRLNVAAGRDKYAGERIVKK